MNVLTATVLLIVFQLIHHAQFLIFNPDDGDSLNDLDDDDGSQKEIKQTSINGSELIFFYSNSILGNDMPIEIAFGNESKVLDYWIKGLPLKVITHGWLASDDNFTGVFCIKTAYVDTGGYNIFTVDWSKIAINIIYTIPAILTESVGNVVAEFLEHLIAYTGIHPSDIHLIGHSLGAHVMGSCGSNFKSEKISRITGLDPACPGFYGVPFRERLDRGDAEFVDVIHTSAGTLGYLGSLGHVDYYPNGGVAPQPGCGVVLVFESMICSHSRSYELYADYVYNNTAFVATQCDTWLNYKLNVCENNTKILMGQDATDHINARGKFYLKTNRAKPFGIL